MNQKSIFNLFSPKGKAQAVVQQGVATMLLSSVALSLVALTACMQVVPASEPVAVVVPPQEEASGQHSIEALPNIDPADRKFFSPGYGAISGVSKEAEVLPTVVKDGVDPDQDIGLMEFFTGVNEAGMQRHDREYGLVAFSHLPEIDADQDIGLMEFFAAPNETSRQHPELGTLEALHNIDPIDRKFFSPGYGAQTVMSGEVEVLPTVVKDEIDPDEDIGLLEFFSPGHGVISGVSKEAEALPTIETDMDGDLGLMEFFSIPNEADAPQAIETHADQDIGLMEFRP